MRLILGQIYEQFLGSLIRLTPSRRIRVDEKPEIAKAGGIVYAPTYIVDYIVNHTLGKMLEGKSPTSAANMHVLDPACGSGSFLLQAYQYLLDWHLDWYNKHNPDSHARGRAPKINRVSENQWRLTTAERKRILLNSIYGVDIDPQATEVTKLSLLLKVLEGESDETLAAEMRLLHARALPDLASNIKCGNSLIGTDFSENLNLFDEERTLKINAFDWTSEFPSIVGGGGFDLVIGNPPYVQLSMFDYYDKEINEYLRSRYSSSMGRMNTFGFFIERSLKSLIKPNGLLSFIVPNTLLTRRLLSTASRPDLATHYHQHNFV